MEKNIRISAVVGIDPGSNGGIVTWRPNHNITAIKMPEDINDIRDYLNHLKTICSPIVFLKTKCAPGWYNAGCRWRQYGKVVPNTKDDGKLWAVESNHFSLRHSVCYGASYEMAKRIEVAGKDKPEKEEKSERKRRYKEIAGNLYPELKPTLWNADATLIMHFGRYILRNNPGWVRQNLPRNMHERLF